MSASNGAIASSHRPRTSTLEGVVEAVNERGLKLDGAWFNESQFRPVRLPAVGAHVRLEVDGRGYIQTLEVLGGVDSGVESGVYSSTSSRDRQIARLSVLKSAAAFAATRADIKSADVLKIAASWLAWVNNDDQT